MKLRPIVAPRGVLSGRARPRMPLAIGSLDSTCTTRHRPRLFRPALERLEARYVLDARLLISELVASNQQGLRDEDGDRPDWVEIFNPSAEPVDLTGWHLTDNDEQLDRWKFPGVTLPPQEYLVVYASGKDRTNPGAPLHTNFRLSAQGEFLALVGPDGSTIAHQYSFPPQRADTSFGLAQESVATTVVGSDSPARFLVPALADNDTDAQGTFWAEIDFDDSSWTGGVGGLGFDDGNNFGEHLGTDVQVQMQGVNSTIYVRVPFQLKDASSIHSLILRMKYDDGYVAYLNGVEVARRNAPDLVGFDARAAAIRRNRDAVLFEDVDLSSQLGLAREGENVLAIHGLNRNQSDGDFLSAPELVAYRPGPIEPDTGRFFALPSPGQPNGQVSFGGFVENITVSVGRGFYDQPQTVTISSETPGAMVVYTSDGSMPSFENGVGILPPTADAGLATNIDVTGTTILRVTAVKEDHLPADVETHTYIFLDDVIRQSADGQAPRGWPTRPVNGQRFDYGMDPDVVDDPRFAPFIKEALSDIPTISLTTDRGNLFDRETGIFVNGVRARGNNRAWERAASVELINPDDSPGFQIDAGLRLRGGFGREGGNPKHAFRVMFREEYGPTKLRFPLFGGEGVDEFDNIDLRAAQVPSWNYFCQPLGPVPGPNGGCAYHTELRDVFSRDTQRDMGQPYTRSRYYHLYLNGQYWGLFQSEERPEASYAASYFGGAKEDYDVIKVESFPHHIEATDGNLEAWTQLWNEAEFGFQSNEAYYRVQGLNVDGSRNPEYPVLLDVDNLIDYMLVIFYTGDLDAPISQFLNNASTNNWFGIRNRNGDEGFRFFVHDAEWTLLDVNENRLGPWRAGETFDQSNPQWIHQQLMQNAEYRLRFADRAHQHLFTGGALAPEASQARLKARANQIDLAIIAESARWGDAQRDAPYTKDDWLAAVRHITDEFIPFRTQILLDQLNKATLDSGVPAPLYPDIAAPEFNQRGGRIAPGFQLDMSRSDDVYFTLDGSDPRDGPATVEFRSLVVQGAPARVLVPQDDSLGDIWTQDGFDDSEWTTANTGIGFDVRGNDLEGLIATNLESSMVDNNATAYVRIPFRVDNPLQFDSLQLEMNYDDGFVAYLNGTEIARINAPDQPVWDSQATARNLSALRAEVLDVSGYLDLLRPEENVLAIHGMNRSETNSDFLILPQLRAGVTTDRGISASATKYTGPVPLSENVVVSARALRDGQWSALNRATFVIDTPSLQISEIMYHPADPSADERAAGFVDDDDFEFIELLNTSASEPVDLQGLSLSGGVQFAFPEMQLAPGQRVVIARNQDALRLRYGQDPNIAGQYGATVEDTRLSNRGESIRLQDALGIVIQEVRYADDWYPLTDGEGYSLEIAAASDPSTWLTKAGWQASYRPGGTPGRASVYPGDANEDGIFNSADLVSVFQAGQYEDEVEGNSTWQEGDWNGDGEFDSGDLVLAFKAGGFVSAATGRFPNSTVLDHVFAALDRQVRRMTSRFEHI